MKTQLDENAIEIQLKIDPEHLEITADADLTEQVIINLVKNAIEAVEGTSNPVLKLTATMDGRGRPIIQVYDNGQGIKEEVLEKIFIPFFTTKGEGSGIGLSLSRQIMRLYGGTITVKSQPNIETIFTLKF